MTKLKNMAENFLQKSQSVQAPIRKGPINPFHSLFQIQELNERENEFLDKILSDGVIQEEGKVVAFDSDLHDLKRITKELKAIQRQEIVLIGERIFEARKIFNEDKYCEESFKAWLEFTFGSYKTGYNYLSFYKLYLALPESLKFSFKDMPARAAYALASKEAPVEQKAEIIKLHCNDTANDIILVIQETFGGTSSRRKSRKNLIDKMLVVSLGLVDKISKKRGSLSLEQRKKIQVVISSLKKLLD